MIHLKESGSARLPSNSDGERLPLAACLDLQYWFFILCKSMRKCYLNIFSNFCNSPPSPSLHKSDSLTGDGVPRNDQELTAWFTSSRVPPAPTCRFLRMGIGELPRGSSTIPWMWSLVSCSFLFASLNYFKLIQHLHMKYLLTEAAGVVFVGYHTGKHTPSFPLFP